MSDPLTSKLAHTLSILEADTHSLKELARKSGYDPFEFYRSSDLSGLDLSGQDLTGLNFERADLRNARLDSVAFDPGALNGSCLSPKDEILQDRFDSYLSDVLSTDVERIYLFVRFRRESIEKCFAATGHWYTEIAKQSGISVDTIRKARRSQVVSFGTARSLAETIMHELRYKNEVSGAGYDGFVRQPFVEFLGLLPKGGFRHVSREELMKLTQMADKIYEVRRRNRGEGDDYKHLWRDGPDTLTWLFKYYADL
jgi:pentapeptide repeat protein